MIYCNNANEQNKFDNLIFKEHPKRIILAIDQILTRKNQTV